MAKKKKLPKRRKPPKIQGTVIQFGGGYILTSAGRVKQFTTEDRTGLIWSNDRAALAEWIKVNEIKASIAEIGSVEGETLAHHMVVSRELGGSGLWVVASDGLTFYPYHMFPTLKDL